MNIKKILLLIICLFIFSGCTIESISDNNIDKNIDVIFSKKSKYLNKDAIGYQYYLPKFMSVKDSNEYNQELYYNGQTYYLFADLVSYYHKNHKDYEIDDKAYISKEIKNGKKYGYLEVNKVGKKYFVEMMYNYAKIETYTNKNNLVDTITNASIILNSIKYNKNVIETLIGDKKYDFSENETYNIFEAKKTNTTNFLDYINEYDKYKGDDLNNLIEKKEIESQEKEN